MNDQEKQAKIEEGIKKIHQQVVAFSNYVRDRPNLIILRNNAANIVIAETIKTAYPSIAVIRIKNPSNGKRDVEMVHYGTSISMIISEEQDDDHCKKLNMKILDHCLEDNVRKFNLFDDTIEINGQPLTPITR